MKKSLGSLIVGISLAVSALNANEVIATVDGEIITKQEVQSMLQAQRMDYNALPKETKENVVNQLVERKLLAKAAQKEGIEKTQAFIDALEKFKQDLALEIWMQEEFRKVGITDAEAKDFYTKNGAQFKQDAQVKARHILVETEDEAKKIIFLLDGVKGGVDAKFIELAKEKSTGPSGANGGDLGWFDKKQMVPEFSKVAFELAKGKYSKAPVKTQFGFHVILVEDKKEAGEVSFDSVKAKIKQNLAMQKFRESISVKAQALRAKAKIELNIK